MDLFEKPSQWGRNIASGIDGQYLPLGEAQLLRGYADNLDRGALHLGATRPVVESPAGTTAELREPGVGRRNSKDGSI
jgi:hypothetical protein